MLELLDTGRMAVKFGKWRGLATASRALFFYAVAFAAVKLQDLLQKFMPNAPQNGVPTLGWTAIGMIVFGQLLLLWGMWQLYRDHVHGDYYLDSERYQDRGR